VTHKEGAAASATPPMALDMTMTAEGKTDVNVDRGLILHTELRSTIDTSMQPPVPGATVQRMRMRGTVNMVNDLVK
jgi:hypothetical protein